MSFTIFETRESTAPFDTTRSRHGNCTKSSPIRYIGIAMGCSGCTYTPKGGKKFRRNLQGKFISAPFSEHTSAPPGRARVHL